MMMIMVVFCQMLCVVMVMAKGVSFFLVCFVFRFVDQGKEIGQYQNEQNEKKNIIPKWIWFNFFHSVIVCVCVFLILFRFKCCCCCCYCCLLLLLLTLFNSGRYYYRQKNKKKPPTTTSSIFVQKLELREYTNQICKPKYNNIYMETNSHTQSNQARESKLAALLDI